MFVISQRNRWTSYDKSPLFRQLQLWEPVCTIIVGLCHMLFWTPVKLTTSSIYRMAFWPRGQISVIVFWTHSFLPKHWDQYTMRFKISYNTRFFPLLSLLECFIDSGFFFLMKYIYLLKIKLKMHWILTCV